MTASRRVLAESCSRGAVFIALGSLGSTLPAPSRQRLARQIAHERDLSPDLIAAAGSTAFSPTSTRRSQPTLGFARHQLLARPFLDFVHPHDPDERRASAKDAVDRRRRRAGQLPEPLPLCRRQLPLAPSGRDDTPKPSRARSRSSATTSPTASGSRSIFALRSGSNARSPSAPRRWRSRAARRSRASRSRPSSATTAPRGTTRASARPRRRSAVGAGAQTPSTSHACPRGHPAAQRRQGRGQRRAAAQAWPADRRRVRRH